MIHCRSGSSLLPSKQLLLGSLVLHRPLVGNWNISGEKAFRHTGSQVPHVDFRTSVLFLLSSNPTRGKERHNLQSHCKAPDPNPVKAVWGMSVLVYHRKDNLARPATRWRVPRNRGVLRGLQCEAAQIRGGEPALPLPPEAQGLFSPKCLLGELLHLLSLDAHSRPDSDRCKQRPGRSDRGSRNTARGRRDNNVGSDKEPQDGRRMS